MRMEREITLCVHSEGSGRHCVGHGRKYIDESAGVHRVRQMHKEHHQEVEQEKCHKRSTVNVNMGPKEERFLVSSIKAP